MEDTLVYLGDAVKATKMDDGSVKLGGYLVRFSTDKDPDLTGDFFTKRTDFGNADNSASWFNHRLPVHYKGTSVEYKDSLPNATLKKDDIGVFAEIVMKARNSYEETIAQMGLEGKLGWSSGTAPHLVDRKKSGDSFEITRWELGVDASLTPTPAEPRNGVVPLKSLFTPNDAVHDGEKETKPITENKMETEKLLAALKAQNDEAIETAVKKAAETVDATIDEKLKAFSATLPDVKAGVQVTKDAADNQQEGNPLEGREFFKAVYQAGAQGHVSKALKAATGMNEAVPSQGGFLVPQATAGAMFERMYSVGEILSRVQRDPVEGNAMDIPAVDETSRVDGSRNGGVLGYWQEEAGSFAATKPKFRNIALKTKKVTALVYATDEMLEDVRFMNSWINRVAPDELRFKVEDAIYNGATPGKPMGWLASPAKIEATRTNASAILFADIVGMWARRWAGVNDYVWFVNQDTMPQLDQLYLTAGTAGIPPRFVDYDGEGVMRMKGAPVIEVEYAPSLGTVGDILLVSPSQYQLIDKASGIKSASSIHVAFTTGEQAFRFDYRVDGEPLWNSPLTPKNGSNTQSPIVALAATT
jgi:HK97 family phage major capsid protein